jgi:hypothetical protein
LFQIFASVGVGTNLGLYQIFFALLSGRFLGSRGALIPALADTGLEDSAVRRSVAALAYGRWNIQTLLAAWQKSVLKEGRYRPHEYEGFRPVACDLVGFFRPRLAGQVGKHYTSKANKALPAMVFAMVAKERAPVPSSVRPSVRLSERMQVRRSKPPNRQPRLPGRWGGIGFAP